MIFFDTTSYLFGSFFGNKKILPNISPNKTYEGLILGFISTIFFHLILSSSSNNVGLTFSFPMFEYL